MWITFCVPYDMLKGGTFWREFFFHHSHCRKQHLWFQNWKLLATLAWWQFFLALQKISYQFWTTSYDLLMKSEVSAECHLMWVGSWHETTWWISWLHTLPATVLFLGEWNMQTPSDFATLASFLGSMRGETLAPPTQPGYIYIYETILLHVLCTV